MFETTVPLPSTFILQETTLVQIPKRAIAGNHRHPRQEAFVCFQNGVELHWLDSSGNKHVQAMQPENGQAFLFVVPSMVPHAVVNKSEAAATLMAYADGPLANTEQMHVAELL